MRSKIIIIAATQHPVNLTTLNWIKVIRFILKNSECILLQNKIHESVRLLNVDVVGIEMDDSLYDFSRYRSALLRSEILPNDIVFMFNDTLGNGRKFGFFLMIFVLKSLISINNGKHDICGPYDYDHHGSWLCPYFVIGSAHELRKLNLTDYRAAEASIRPEILVKIDNWLNSSWRHSRSSTSKQKEIKRKTLILERELLTDRQKKNMYKFSKYSVLRMLNSKL